MKIVQTHKEIAIKRGFKYIGTYEKGEYTLDKNMLIKSSTPYIRVICPYCKKEYDVAARHFKSGGNCGHCCNEYKKSFAYHIQQELKQPLSKYWDWGKNTVNPYVISKNRNGKNKQGDNLKVWIKCTETDYHGSYEVSCMNFVKGKRCPYCVNQKVHPKDSIMQWCIDNVDSDFESKYLSDKNTLDLWTIAPRSRTKIWFKCQEVNYHHDYLMDACEFIYKSQKHKCPQCVNSCGNVHPKDSFGELYPNKAKYWDYNKNDTSPHEVTPHSHVEYWFKCEKCEGSFLKSINHLNRVDVGVICKKCCSSEGEQLIKNYLDNIGLINQVDYFHDKEYFKDLKGIKGGILRPDFVLPKYKIWIEFDGGQHDEFVPWMHRTYDNFIKQQKHDELKNEYALKNGWILIRINSKQKDNIEEILNNIFKEIL